MNALSHSSLLTIMHVLTMDKARAVERLQFSSSHYAPLIQDEISKLELAIREIADLMMVPA